MADKSLPRLVSLLRLVAWSLVLWVGGTVTAMAHHSSTSFDQSKQYIFHGTVNKFLWTNPHIWLFATVQKADNSSELWGFEANGPNVLSRRGWHIDTLKVGDKITIYGNPQRDGKRNALMSKVVLTDGQVLLASPDIEEAAGAGGTLDNGLPPLPKVTPVEYR